MPKSGTLRVKILLYKPNVTGAFGLTGNDDGNAFSTSYTDGCFTTQSTTKSGLDSGGSSYRKGIPKMDASRSSSVYKTSGKVYPLSLALNYVIKY